MHSSSAKSQFLWWHPVPWFTLPHSMELHRQGDRNSKFQLFHSEFFDLLFSIFEGTHPRILLIVVLFGFRRYVHGERARQRQQWHLTPLSTRAGRRWQIVWQGHRLGFAAETVTIDALSTIFLLLPRLFFFFFFSVLIPVCFSSSRCFVRAAATWILFSKY